MEKKRVFRSRISVLLSGFIIATFIPISMPMFQEGLNTGTYILCGSFVFIVLLSVGIRYVISGDKLFIKIFWFIPTGSAAISEIVSMERSYNPFSSPAVSLKRLQISFTGGWSWLISPAREPEFIEELKVINPRINTNVPIKKGIWRIQDWDI